MNKQELLQKIEEWEVENGESFNDYFSHDAIDAKHWSDFLSKTGYETISVSILEECSKNERGWCLDQQLMFELNPIHDNDGNFVEENDTLNNIVLVDYFFENKDLLESAINFLNEN